MKSSLGSLALALALAACRTDSTGTAIQASLLEAEDPPRFSDWSAPVNLGLPVNTALSESDALISKDGLGLYFVSLDRPGGQGGFDIWVSQRASINDPWGDPVNLGPNINSAANEAGPTLSRDGHQLFFHSGRSGGFGGNDLYSSRRRSKRDDLGWAPAENLGGLINTAAAESFPAYFEDDATEAITLYFTSNRLGGLGADDVYASTLNQDGTFGPPTLVSELSSALNDRQPSIRRDGLEMFLASDRPGGVGLQDLWVATRATTTDAWSTPANLGSVVNSASLDARPALSFKGTELYFQSNRPGGFGAFDLYVVTRSKLTGPD
jgi:Tol biopolymer transport system component